MILFYNNPAFVADWHVKSISSLFVFNGFEWLVICATVALIMDRTVMSEFAVALQVVFNIVGMFFLLLFIIFSFRRSSIGIFVLVAFSWYFIGLYLVPMLIVFGWIPEGGNVYAFNASSYGLAASFHCFLLSLGMLLGFGSKIYKADVFFVRAIDHSIGGVEWTLLKRIIILGLFSFSLFFYLVGIDTALVNAAAARGGDFEGFGSGKSFLFLKTIGASSLLGGALLYYLLYEKKVVYVFLYLVVVVLAYLNSISRNLILTSIIAPLLAYQVAVLRLRRSTYAWFVFGLVFIFVTIGSLFVVQYGKIFGHFLSSIFDVNAVKYDLTEEGRASNLVSAFLSNYVFLWSSVDAGISHFFANGSYFTPEPFFAILLGWIPAGVLKSIGLGGYYYGDLSESLRIACVNGSAFIDGGCTVPPAMSGYSAYALPFVGALICGYIVGFFTKIIECVWVHYESKAGSRVWAPYFIYVTFLNLLTFIPSTQAYSVFSFVLIFLFARAIKFLKQLKFSS